VFLQRAESPRADAMLEADERARRLWQAIQGLDPKYRVPLVLFHYEEQSYQQIADTMELSMAAVEARIHRARKQLAKALGPLLDQL
jgi:RNA polymerase sigma-70 factor (ECF subfamily)